MKTLKLAGILLLVSAPAGAVETASFLNVGAGARALGQGGAYTALTDDANSIYWNPAGLASIDKREILASHAELAQGVRHDVVAYAQSSPLGVFGGALTYLSQDALDGRDALGRPTGGFQASDAAAAFAFGRRTEAADVGASVKYLRSHIGSAEAQTFAVDLGTRKTVGPIAVGAALRNAGPGMKFDSETDDLPLRLALGAAYKFDGGHSFSFDFTNGPRGSGSDESFGGEYQALKGFFVRAGYSTLSAIGGGSGFDAAKGLTLGVGARQGPWIFDYAAVPMGELGSTHRFTLGARW